MELHDVLPPRPAGQARRAARLRLRASLLRTVWWFALGALTLVVGAVVAWKWPALTAPRGAHVEAAAISALRNVRAAQNQFSQRRSVPGPRASDPGLPGTLAELSGGAALRGRTDRLSPPVLAGGWRIARPDGSVDRSGYRFQLWLRTDDGRAVQFPPADGATRMSSRWCVYAWPATPEDRGEATLFVDDTGRMFRSAGTTYRGDDGPRPEAAFVLGGTGRFGTLGASIHTGQDGATWRQVN